MPLTIRELARLGAQHRVEELRNELARLTKEFPDVASDVARTDVARDAAPKAKRFQMSAAQRKAVSVRMKRYWASRRASKSK